MRRFISLVIIGMFISSFLSTSFTYALEIEVEEDFIYTIKRGDTLAKIAKRYLHDPMLWPKLWLYSGNTYIRNPNRIYAGRKLVIPSSEPIMVKREVIEKKEELIASLKEDVKNLRASLDTLKDIKKALIREKEEEIARLENKIRELRGDVAKLEREVWDKDKLIKQKETIIKTQLEEIDREITDVKERAIEIRKEKGYYQFLAFGIGCAAVALNLIGNNK